LGFKQIVLFSLLFYNYLISTEQKKLNTEDIHRKNDFFLKYLKI